MLYISSKLFQVSIIGLAGVILGIALLRHLYHVGNLNIWVQRSIPLIVFWIVFTLFVVISVTFDMHLIVDRRAGVFVEELSELIMSLSLLFSSIYLCTLADDIQEFRATRLRTS